MTVKSLFLLIAILIPLALAGGEEIDFIVMVDISASMEPYFEDLVTYFSREILPGMFHPGDGFHFLTFSGYPEIGVSETISENTSVDSIILRMSLLQPIGLYTDLISAVQFLVNFTEELPEPRSKRIVLMTDGVHDPPPGKSHTVDSQTLLNEMLAEAEVIKRRGWQLHILKLPVDDIETPEASTSVFLEEFAKKLETPVVPYDESENSSHTVSGVTTLEFPGSAGTVNRRFRVRFFLTNHGAVAHRVVLRQILWGDTNILDKSVNLRLLPEKRTAVKAVIRLPDSTASGPHEIPLRLVFSDGFRTVPEGDILTFELRSSDLAGSAGPEGASNRIRAVDRGRLLRVYPYILIAAALILSAALLVFLVRKRAGGRRKMLSPFPRETAQSGPLIEMRVQLQNPHIGKRNINGIGGGTSRTIGGGHSDFLIFLVPFPPHVAEIQHSGVSYIFKPVRKEFFPGMGESIENCMDRDIPALSSKGYPITIHFRPYISPLDEIHKILHATESQGRNSR